MYDIIVCGSNTVDVFVTSDADLIRISGSDHGKSEEYIAYPLGTKIPMKTQFHIGGGGTNLLATFVAQQLTCAYIGNIGSGTNAHSVYAWLKKNNITFLGQTGGETGYSVILDSEAEDRTILVNKGANDELEFSKIPTAKLQTKWFYGTSMHGKSFVTLEKLFVFMRNHGVKTVFNPNNNVLSHGLDHVRKIFSHTDILILNRDEARLLLPSDRSTKLLTEHLMTFGPKIVVVTDGARGATIHVSKEWANVEEGFHIAPAKQRKIVETTGAGDAFGSGFVSGLIQGKSIRESVLLAVLNAEGTISQYGAKEGILTKEDADRLLQAESKKPLHKITPL